MKISVSMITLNEEKNIARAITSCSFADEIVVVDGGSADRTLDILRSNDKVVLIQHPWENHFGKQRQACLEHCTGDWVVRLDADEAFSREFEEGIRTLLSATPAEVIAYRVRQCNLVGNENYYAKEFDNYEAIPRIWRNLPGIEWEGQVHEKLIGSGGIVRHWDVYTVHYGFLDKRRYRQKGVYYSQTPGSGLKDPERLYYREYDIQDRPFRASVAPRVLRYEPEVDLGGPPEIAIVRGFNLDKSELRNYEPLSDNFSITVYISDDEDIGQEDIRLPVISLVSGPDNRVILEGLEIDLFDKDIIYSTDYSCLSTVQEAIIKHKFGKKMVVLEKDNKFSSGEKSDMSEKLKQVCRGFVDVFVAATEGVKDTLLSECVPGERIVVIPMGMDVDPEITARKFALLFDKLFQATYKGAVRELAEYTGLPANDILKRIHSIYSEQVREWKEVTGEKITRDKVDEFYRNTGSYLFDLVQYNYESPYYIRWTDDIFNFCASMNKEMGGVRVLDFGGGIGSQLISLSALKGAELSYADIPGRTFEYAEWRFRRRHLDINMLDASENDFLEDRTFDVVIALDVIEHLIDPEAAVGYLVKHIKDGGCLITVTSFVDNYGEAGWHLNVDRYTDDKFYNSIEKSGMEMLNKDLPRYFRKPFKDPDDLKPRIDSAIAGERFADAKSLMEEHLEMHPADIDTLLRHAGISLRLGAYGPASDSIGKVLLFCPDSPEALELAEEIRRRTDEITSDK